MVSPGQMTGLWDQLQGVLITVESAGCLRRGELLTIYKTNKSFKSYSAPVCVGCPELPLNLLDDSQGFQYFSLELLNHIYSHHAEKATYQRREIMIQ